MDATSRNIAKHPLIGADGVVLAKHPHGNSIALNSWMKRDEPVHNLKDFADRRRTLRHNLTPAEALLWRNLKNAQLEGKKFRRQHGIGPYIVDFYCPESRVIVELDGAGHKGILAGERDAVRTRYLERLGIQVLRFENHSVFDSLEFVLESIRAALQEK